MHRHWMKLACLVVAGAAAATLSVPTAAAAAGDRHDPPVRVFDDTSRALQKLRADAPGPVRVSDGVRGGVDFVHGRDGAAMVHPAGGTTVGPRAAAGQYLRRYGALVGVDGQASEAVVTQTIPSAAGGTVVRAQQQVSGLPVFGGEVVLSLDSHEGLTSLAAASTPATRVSDPVVSSAAAEQTALAITTKAHGVDQATLEASSKGRWLYDPALVDVFDPLGARPVWRFEVSNGAHVRELVLVDAARGGVVLHYNQVAGLDRVVCDHANDNTFAGDPQCLRPARRETSGPTGQSEVDAAFDNTGATSALYEEVAGLDLTELIGWGDPGSRQLLSLVRWCFYFDPCPMDNAFWDGTFVVFGDGYAAADDIVAHELTHGVIDHTSQLFYLHQSGAINESLADVIGEIVDHRTNPAGGEDNSAWLLGEDAPGGALRSMKDPTLFGQPDTMTSPLYASGSIDEDSGQVHTNNGVGNKAAYLISQGGTFNGVTIAGVDGTDPRLTKTATLYTEVIKRLTSGSEYADLARVLTITCDELAAAGSAGFTGTDCQTVRRAVSATQMTQPQANPEAAAAEAPDTCPAGTYKKILFRDDDDTANSWNEGGLWTQAPNTDWGVPGYASSGTRSWFGIDPDPRVYNDPYSSTLGTTGGVEIPTGSRTYLHFHHAHVFEWYDATDTTPARYPDGGTVSIMTHYDRGDGIYTERDSSAGLAWVNGPSQPITNTSTGSPLTGFGGDSRGYGSSRVELTPLAGQLVWPQWTVVGDEFGSYLGWWIDDIEIYTCPSAIPTAPRNLSARGLVGGATLTWTPPSYTGSGITGYRITRSDGITTQVPATSRQATLTKLPAGRPITFTVTALNRSGAPGAKTSATLQPTSVTIRPSTRRVKKWQAFTITGRLVRAGTTTGVARHTLLLERREPGTASWQRVYTDGRTLTRSDGTIRWTTSQRRTYDYRAMFPGTTRWFGARSPIVRVSLR